MIPIIPAILSTREEDYSRDINRYQSNNVFNKGWVHIDFMDNKFVPNQSIEPKVIGKYPISMKKEAHLMVKDFDSWIQELEKVNFERIIIHFEASDESRIRDGILYLKNHGIESGLAFNPSTGIEKVTPFLSDLDLVLIMGVEPGFQGSPFVENTYDRVKKMIKLKKGNTLPKIVVDGGVRDSNAKQLVASGVDYLIVGSFLLKGNIDENFEKLKKTIDG